MSATCIGVVEHGEIETGKWCVSCQLPSAVDFDMLIVSIEGVSTVGRAHYCLDCGALS